MNLFKFKIEKDIAYSPGWHGTMPKCPKKVTILLYNDKEGYGVAQTKDKFIPPEVLQITEFTAKDILTKAKDEDGVYFGTKLVDRWLKAEVIV